MLTTVLTAGNRALLVTATVLLAVGTSLLTTGKFCWFELALVFGSAITLYVSDVGREAEAQAQELARRTRGELAKARSDVLSAIAGRWTAAAALVGGGFALAGLIGLAT